MRDSGRVGGEHNWERGCEGAVWLQLVLDMTLATGIGNPVRHLLDKHVYKALQYSGLISLNGV